ncbi:MAG TPA: peptidoglycan-associated lipoprotein Pal [bacterium]|uniref:Peptidoglycan-associated lipoprotein n=1 Tax=candidate division TA06 bacterium ADurb.Bin417 TaxID=1852828 RepID=A0A1V5MCJ8_UNCT6|nr:MAG: Peptidoglycan-associated lipoprotein precursor [candidate division TA06 bacterium ADurb.Bin417]HNQ35702.1 peptidoglycan-associated lipoprotein Pal [bacterium]HNS48184.1 peptidoglycan-associated lipoprotein Pal [bacterium]
MRKWMMVLGMVVLAGILAGCACKVPSQKQITSVPPSTGTEVKPAAPGTPSTPVVPEVGRATPQEERIAMAGGDIPLKSPTVPENARPPRTEIEKQVFQIIHFDFDKSDIRPDAQKILEGVADYLKKNPSVKIVVEGHCDEAGTEEYNLALGERRALAARRYLVTLGIAPDRVTTLSFGESWPFDPEHNEKAWALNRRGEFKIVE